MVFIKMRIWHEQLIPKLCQKHLCGMNREMRGAYNIIANYWQTKEKRGYFNHPATQEFLYCPNRLYGVMQSVVEEMKKRGYHPSPLPEKSIINGGFDGYFMEWQSLDEQIKILRFKGCKCNV